MRLDKSRSKVTEITVGSRNEENITDAADPGGRLGPQVKVCKPKEDESEGPRTKDEG